MLKAYVHTENNNSNDKHKMKIN